MVSRHDYVPIAFVSFSWAPIDQFRFVSIVGKWISMSICSKRSSLEMVPKSSCSSENGSIMAKLRPLGGISFTMRSIWSWQLPSMTTARGSCAVRFLRASAFSGATSQRTILENGAFVWPSARSGLPSTTAPFAADDCP